QGRTPTAGSRSAETAGLEITCSSAHLTGSVNIQGPEAAIQLQQDRQADTGFGGGQGDHQDEHHLAIRLLPTGTRHDEGQRCGVHHDLQAHQHIQDVAPDHQPGETKAEQHGGQRQAVFHGYAVHATSLASWRPIWIAVTMAPSSIMAASSTARIYGPNRAKPTALASTTSPVMTAAEGWLNST